MDTQIDIVGASSEVYRFRLVDSRGPQVRTGGTFIYVREGDDGEPEVVYAGQADNLMDEAMLRWPRAVETYGATRVYARLRVSGSERRQELQDLLDALRPAMNAAVGELAA
jgi:hypothetical protein